MRKFKLKQRVVPVGKTAEGYTLGLENSYAWKLFQRSACPFLVIEEFAGDDNYPLYFCSGDCFHERDLVDFEEWKNTQIHQPRKFSAIVSDFSFQLKEQKKESLSARLRRWKEYFMNERRSNVLILRDPVTGEIAGQDLIHDLDEALKAVEQLETYSVMKHLSESGDV